MQKVLQDGFLMMYHPTYLSDVYAGQDYRSIAFFRNCNPYPDMALSVQRQCLLNAADQDSKSVLEILTISIYTLAYTCR